MTDLGPPPDTIVVGGGLVGVSLGYELVSRGANVHVVDAGFPGQATRAGAGIISPETTVHPHPQFFDLAMRAGEHHRRLADSLGGPGTENGYEPCSLLRVALGPGEDPFFRETASLMGARTPGVLEPCGVDEAQAMFPPLTRPRQVLVHRGAARVDGSLLRDRLLHEAIGQGLTVRSGKVDGLRTNGDRVQSVSVDGAWVPCGSLALCGGAWTAQLSGLLGVDLPVSPQKGQIVHVHLPGKDSAGWPIVQPVLGYYLVPWPDGRVACGGTVEPEAGFDTRSTVAGARELLREAVKLAPGLADATLLHIKNGLRPATPDDMPLLGAVPGLDNAFVATGHGANGLLLGPYSGRLLAELISDGSPSFNLHPFRPDRFDGSSVNDN